MNNACMGEDSAPGLGAECQFTINYNIRGMAEHVLMLT